MKKLKLFEAFKKIKKDPRRRLELSRKISDEMKTVIMPYVMTNSKYNKSGVMTGLKKPSEARYKSVGFGADKNGFFVYTHRARSKSYTEPSLIPDKDVIFIASTG